MCSFKQTPHIYQTILYMNSLYKIILEPVPLLWHFEIHALREWGAFQAACFVSSLSKV